MKLDKTFRRAQPILTVQCDVLGRLHVQALVKPWRGIGIQAIREQT
jgi:hypothetical protein